VARGSTGLHTKQSKVFPDYALTSASFNSLYGIGVVRVAAQVKRGIMAARS